MKTIGLREKEGRKEEALSIGMKFFNNKKI